MTDRYSEDEAAVLSELARALLDQVVLFGYASEVALDQQVRASFQQAKRSRAHLLHDLTAQMWRLGIPAIHQGSSIAMDRVSELRAIVRDHDAIALGAVKVRERDLRKKLEAAIASDHLGGHLRNFLQTILSRSETDVDALDALTHVAVATSLDSDTELAADVLAGIPALPRALHVLLVEDNPAVADVTMDMMQYLGWRVTRACDAAAALAVLSDDVDLMFSDVVMHGDMNGLELAHVARQRRPSLPIVLTSGYVERVQRQADDARIPLLAKPYSLDALANVLDAARPPR